MSKPIDGIHLNFAKQIIADVTSICSRGMDLVISTLINHAKKMDFRSFNIISQIKCFTRLWVSYLI